MDNYTFYGICPVCGYVLTKTDVNPNATYVCPVCGAAITGGISTLQTNNVTNG